MRRSLFLATALSLPLALAASGLALAQPAPADPAPPQAQAPVPSPPPPGPRGPGMGGSGMPGPGMPGSGPRGPGMMEAHGPMRGWHRGPPPSRAASFHFQRDDAEIHIHCAEGEPTRACVDAAAVLLDKLGAMPSR